MKKELIKDLIVEALQKPLKKEGCGCGCGCSTNEAPILTESKVKNILSEGLQYHIDNKIPLHDTIYRYSSDKHLSLIKETKKLYSRGVIDLAEGDKQLIETNLGEFGMFEGEVVPLDLPMMNEASDTNMVMYLLQLKQDLKGKGFDVKVGKPSKLDNKIQVQHMKGDLDDLVGELNDMLGKEGYRIVFDTNQPMLEAYRTGTWAGRPILLIIDGDEKDWEVEFEDGKRIPYEDVKVGLKLDQPLDEAFSGFQRNPEDPESKPSEPTGLVAQFKEDLRELFGKWKNNLDNPEFIKGVAEVIVNWKSLVRSQLKEYSEYGGREVKLNKPKRGGSKAYYVYVKDPRTKKVKKVQFGSGGLRAKINDKDARQAYAARHRCSTKKDRTKPGYWSCNLPRYAKALKLGKNMNTFWSLLWGMFALFI